MQREDTPQNLISGGIFTCWNTTKKEQPTLNALECTAIIINYIAIIAAMLDTPRDHEQHLTALFFTDNVVSKAWIQKGAEKSLVGKALGLHQCAIMTINLVGINTGHKSTKDNIIVNLI